MHARTGTGRRCDGRRALAALALFAAASADAPAAALTSPFTVTVNFTNQASCDWSTGTAQARARFKLDCSQSKAFAPRGGFLLHVFRAGEWLGSVDAVTGDGTITSWRVVHVANRDYLEIMVGW